MDRWYVTWRHSDQQPLGARIYYVDNKEEGIKLQKKLLTNHQSEICFKCSSHRYNKGNNDNIVTTVRTENEILDTVSEEMAKPENSYCYHPVTFCMHPSHEKH